MTTMKYIMYCDGATENSNPSDRTGIGIVCYAGYTNDEVFRMCEHTGPGTNNWAEYMSLIIGLDTAHQRGIKNISVYMDSKLVVKQSNQQWKVKHEDLKPLNAMVLEMKNNFDTIEIYWTPRENNYIADGLSKSALKKKFNPTSMQNK